MILTIDLPELDEHPEYLGIIAKIYKVDVEGLSAEDSLELIAEKLKVRFLNEARNYILVQVGFEAQAQARTQMGTL